MLRCSRLLVAVASISGAASAAFVPSGFGAVQMGLHSRGRGASVRSRAQSLGKEGARGICMAGETIIFDVTNTLMELKEPVGTTYARIASGHGIAVDDEAEIEAAFRREFGKMQPLQYIDVAGDRHLAEVKEREWWKILVRRVLDCDESPAYDQCFDECFHHFGTSSAWQLFPEVCDTLDALKLDGWRLGILSNWDVRLQTVVSQLGLLDSCEFVVLPADAGASKPDRKIFEEALRRASDSGTMLSANQCLYVGDSIKCDVQGAMPTGMHPILVDRKGKHVHKDIGCEKVSSLNDLVDIAQKIRDEKIKTVVESK